MHINFVLILLDYRNKRNLRERIKLHSVLTFACEPILRKNLCVIGNFSELLMLVEKLVEREEAKIQQKSVVFFNFLFNFLLLFSLSKN